MPKIYYHMLSYDDLTETYQWHMQKLKLHVAILDNEVIIISFVATVSYATILKDTFLA